MRIFRDVVIKFIGIHCFFCKFIIKQMHNFDLISVLQR